MPNKTESKICPECGKSFVITTTHRWAYIFVTSNNCNVYFCSYSCLQKNK